MRQTTITTTMLVAASCAIVLQATFVSLPRRLKAYGSRIGSDMATPVETFVDWLQSAYGGPLGPDDPVSH